jgi:hypothetical protein
MAHEERVTPARQGGSVRGTGDKILLGAPAFLGACDSAASRCFVKRSRPVASRFTGSAVSPEGPLV